MEQRLVPGAEVEHAGRRWRVHQPLGPDAVLLRNEAGEIVSAEPSRIVFPAPATIGRPGTAIDEQRCTDAQWAEAARRRDILTKLARLPARTRSDLDAAAKELGIKPRRIWALLRRAETGECDIAMFLPSGDKRRAKRLDAGVEAPASGRSSSRQSISIMRRPSGRAWRACTVRLVTAARSRNCRRLRTGRCKPVSVPGTRSG
jgi:hypothetical protein